MSYLFNVSLFTLFNLIVLLKLLKLTFIVLFDSFNFGLLLSSILSSSSSATKESSILKNLTNLSKHPVTKIFGSVGLKLKQVIISSWLNFLITLSPSFFDISHKITKLSTEADKSKL